jgi:hypothetical protein
MNRGRQRAQWRTRLQQQSLALSGRGRPQAPNPRTVQIRIHELVLRGFPKSSAGRIAAEFERELTALLQAQPLPAAWRAATSLEQARAAPLRLRSLTDARGVGEQLARAILDLQTGREPEAAR